MIVMVVAVVASLVSVTAQEPAGLIADTGDTWTWPLTPWGDPDLQGAWDISTTTPLERPRELGERDSFTEEEASARDEEITTAPDRRGATPEEDFVPYNAFWWDRGRSLDTLRAFLIMDPPNGRLPAFTPDRKGERETKRGRGVEPIRGRTGACTTGVSFARAYRGCPVVTTTTFRLCKALDMWRFSWSRFTRRASFP